MTTPAVDLPNVDIHSDAFYQDPFPTYAQLRRSAPVHELAPGLFFVTTMPLVKQALLDPGLFSSVQPAARRSSPPPEVADEVAALRAQGFAYVPALGVNDDPDHARYRKMVNRAFTPRALQWMEPLVDSAADSLVSAVPDGEPFDFLEAIARPLPIWAILRIMGMDEDRRDDVRRWSEAATATLGGIMTAEQWLDSERTMLDFQREMAAELDARRARPTDDLLSMLLQTEGDERQLTNGELVWLIRELIIAGNETTTRVLSDMPLTLEDRPELLDQMAGDFDLRRRVAEESVRLSSPVTGMWRRVTRDTKLAGVRIPAESTVFLTFTSANRDENVFPRGDEFDIERPNLREHSSFGYGIHVCVGAGLARIELASMLRALSEQLSSIHVIDRPALRYQPSYGMRGLVTIPVTVERR